jgi:hypothetical protein
MYVVPTGINSTRSFAAGLYEPRYGYCFVDMVDSPSNVTLGAPDVCPGLTVASFGGRFDASSDPAACVYSAIEAKMPNASAIKHHR